MGPGGNQAGFVIVDGRTGDGIAIRGDGIARYHLLPGLIEKLVQSGALVRAGEIERREFLACQE